jgi:zinc protease
MLAATTADEVREAAGRHLDPEAVAAVLYLPQDRGADLTPERLARAFAVTAAHRPVRPSVGPSVRPDRPVRPVRPSPPLADVHHAALPAFDLLVRRKPGVPTVTLGVYIPRVAFDPPGKAGLATVAVRSAIRGAGGLDSAALAFAFERLGGTLGSSVTLDWLGHGVTVLAPHLRQAAELLERVHTVPDLADEAALAERALLVEETSQVADDMFRYPFQLAFAVAFGDRGYGVPALGLPEQAATVTPEEVRAWHRQALLAPRGVVIAVGDLEPAAALDDLAAVFGSHPPRPAGALNQAVPWALDGKPAARTATRRKAQSAFALAFPGPSRRDQTRYAAEVWSAIASGLGGRLFEALRDRRSLAYTVVASSWQKARGGAFLAYIATSPEREEEARTGMLRELAKFAEEPVSADELDRAVNYLVGQTAVQRQSGSALAGEILDAWLAGEGLKDLEEATARYRAVTAEAVRAVAERVLSGPRAEGGVRGGGDQPGAG